MKRGFFLACLALAGLAAPAWAQATREVTGVVRMTGTGQPLPDVTVSLAGGTASARTNDQGQYRIRVPVADVTLIARSIGYKRQSRMVPMGQGSADFSLEKDVLLLERVTVTGQATTLSSRNATTAVSGVDGNDVVRSPGQDVVQQLQGKVVGASINMNSGAPGGAGQIQIRGVTSVLGAGQPLIVVDGIIISNESFSSGANAVTGASGGGMPSSQDAMVNRLSDLNPQEIESVEVLKSAAATALYGSRATNGVVVIKTKKGLPGAPRFNLTQRVGTQNQLRRLGTRRFTDVQQVVDLPYGNGESGKAWMNSAYPTGKITGYFDTERAFYDRPDPSQETILSLSGGVDRTQYFAQATSRRETGLAPNTGANLTAIRINVDQALLNTLKTSVGINVTRNILNRGLSNNDNTNTSPVYVFAYKPGVIDLTQRDATGNYVQNPFNGGGNSTSNPFQTFEYLQYGENVWRQTAFANTTWNAWEAGKHRLDVNHVVGFDRLQQDSKLFSPGFMQYEGNDNFFGRALQGNINQFNLNQQLNAVWSWNPGAWLNATTSVGTAYENQRINQYYLRARGLLPGTTNVDQGTQTSSNGIVEFRDQAFYGNTQLLLLNEKLTLAGGFRADRSSANGDREKFYVFPRASAAYRWDNPLSTIDNVKFRFAYGQTGNRPRFSDRYIVLGSGSLIGGQPTLVRPGTVNNPSIEPEKLKEVEGGIDFAILNSRIAFEGTVFNRTLTDQLFTAPAPPSGGFNTLVLNTGELQTKGTELALNTLPIQRRNLTWTSRASFQKFTMTAQGLPPSIPRFVVPGSFGAAFGRNAIATGYSTTAIWGNVPINPTTREVLPFGTTITGTRGTDWIPNDTVVGNSQPDFQMFFSNIVTWKRFSFSGLVDYRQGGDVANMTLTLFDEGGTSRDYDKASPMSGRSLGEYRYDAWAGGNDVRAYLQSGTNVRLRELAVSYDADPTLAARVFGAKSLRFTVQGRNLWMKTDYWSYDPEFNNFGNTNLNRFIDLAPFPGVRSYFFSVDVGF